MWVVYRAQLTPIFWQTFLLVVYRVQLLTADFLAGVSVGRLQGAATYRQFSGRRFCGSLTGRSYRQFSGRRFCRLLTGRSYAQFSSRGFCGSLTGCSYRQFSERCFCGSLTGRSYRQCSSSGFCGSCTRHSYHQFSGRRFCGSLTGGRLLWFCMPAAIVLYASARASQLKLATATAPASAG